MFSENSIFILPYFHMLPEVHIHIFILQSIYIAVRFIAEFWQMFAPLPAIGRSAYYLANLQHQTPPCQVFFDKIALYFTKSLKNEARHRARIGKTDTVPSQTVLLRVPELKKTKSRNHILRHFMPKYKKILRKINSLSKKSINLARNL